MHLGCFEKFIFRCPLFPLKNIAFEMLNKIEQEAIFLASPDLFTEIMRTGKDSQKTNNKKELSVLKYQIRMRSRCTPFGLFAGCGIGEIGNKSEIILDGINSYKSHTRLDMDFLCTLLQSMNSVKEQLIYYPNSSLYKILNSYRYVEYHYVNGLRKHDLAEIESDIYLEKVLTLCERGCHYSGIIETLNKEENVEKESIKEYIDDLIENQVLVSNLHPKVTGEDLLHHIIHVMDEFSLAPEIKDILVSIKTQLNNIDELNLGRNLELYQHIENDIKLLNIKYQRRFLFQTDTYVRPLSAKISTEIVETVKEGIVALNKLIPKMEDPMLTSFAKEFYTRYEEEEIPLVEALDPDIGIGFSNLTPGNIDFHPLIDNIEDNLKGKTNNITEFSQTELFLLKKYQSCIENDKNTIVITDDDLNEFSYDSVDLPATFSAMIEVIQPKPNKELPIIILKSVGGSSAANFINRFCHLNSDIKNYTTCIIQKENEITGLDKIIAEIVHLPQSRTGNILFRPALREYEIPYLAKESVKEEFKIPISDLLISVKGGKTIRLRSNKLNKEIVPRLTTAHNFITNSLPIYHFLCSLQAYETKVGLSFIWGPYFDSKSFLPRVIYKNIIFSLARWNFEKGESIYIPDVNSINFMNEAAAFKKKNNLPDLVSLVKGDNKLLIDFGKEEFVRLLFSEIKNEGFVLEEVIDYSESSFIKSDNKSYINEVILGFYKKRPAYDN